MISNLSLIIIALGSMIIYYLQLSRYFKTKIEEPNFTLFWPLILYMLMRPLVMPEELSYYEMQVDTAVSGYFIIYAMISYFTLLYIRDNKFKN